MVDPDSRQELGRDVDASMRMFERSQTAGGEIIAPVRPSRVMVVLDRSPQDDASVAAAGTLRERFNTETLVLDGAPLTTEPPEPPGTPGDYPATRTAEISGGREIVADGDTPHAKILAAVAQHDVDLVIVPCPFGRPLEDVGTDSAGTVIDVMLGRLGKPMLVIRRHDMTFADCTARVALVLGAESDGERLASSWAVGLAAEGALLSLNLVLEKEAYENMRSIFEALQPEAELSPEAFGHALAQSHATLHASMAKTASAAGMSYRLMPQAGEVAPPNPLQDDQRMLLVMPLEVDDRFIQGFIQDRIRRSPHPVLVVPGHVPPAG